MPPWLEFILVAIWLIGWAGVAVWSITALWNIGDPVLFVLFAPFMVATGWMWPAMAAFAIIIAVPSQLVGLLMERAGVRRY